jgi:adenylate cyclase
MIEIERKFLVTSNEYVSDAFRSTRIVQGYLNSNPERTVRIRIKGEKGYITIKGKGNKSGLSRFEWEKEIPVADAERLLLLCEKGIIDKIRHEVKFDTHIIEVDVFFGENEGLVIAEIEVKSENEKVEKPVWLGKEVTNIEKYYNAYLSKHPFESWK